VDKCKVPRHAHELQRGAGDKRRHVRELVHGEAPGVGQIIPAALPRRRRVQPDVERVVVRHEPAPAVRHRQPPRRVQFSAQTRVVFVTETPPNSWALIPRKALTSSAEKWSAEKWMSVRTCQRRKHAISYDGGLLPVGSATNQ